jgi:hypothetical protein
MPNSKIEEAYLISKDQAVVSFLQHAKKPHAVLILESMRTGEETYEMFVADFMPKNVDCYGASNLSMLLWDGIYDSRVRAQTKKGIHDASWEEIVAEYDEKAAEEDRRSKATREPFNLDEPSLHMHTTGISREIPKEDALKLKREILDDEKKAQNGNLRFNIYGINASRVFKMPHHNCTTWAVEKLAKINIKLEKSSGYLDGCIPTQPKHFFTNPVNNPGELSGLNAPPPAARAEHQPR